MEFDRVYKLENAEFLNEPTYVHRCKLIDDSNQREMLEKYIELLKSSPSKNGQDGNRDDCDKDDNLNSSHISMDSIEIDIDCISKELTELKTANATNYQYTIKVIDYKKIKSGYTNKSDYDYENSSLADSSKSQQRQAESFYTGKSVEVIYKDRICTNETNDNTCTVLIGQQQNLSNNYLDNTTGSTSIISCYVSDLKPQTIDFNFKEKQNDHELKDLNQNESLYAISESTRIQAGDKDGTYDDIENITQTNGNDDICQDDKDVTLQEMISVINKNNGEENVMKEFRKIEIRKSNGLVFVIY